MTHNGYVITFTIESHWGTEGGMGYDELEGEYGDPRKAIAALTKYLDENPDSQMMIVGRAVPTKAKLAELEAAELAECEEDETES